LRESNVALATLVSEKKTREKNIVSEKITSIVVGFMF